MLLDTKRMYKNQKELTCLGIVIKKYRVDKLLSQEQLGFIAGLDRTYISGLERGVRNPSFLILLRIIKACNITPLDFFKYYTDVVSENNMKAVNG